MTAIAMKHIDMKHEEEIVAEARRITDLTLEELAEVERLESELDGFVTKRARQAKEQKEIEDLWAESERKALEKRRRENRALWYSYHLSLCESHTRIAQDHEAKALQLLEVEPRENGHDGEGVLSS